MQGATDTTKGVLQSTHVLLGSALKACTISGVELCLQVENVANIELKAPSIDAASKWAEAIRAAQTGRGVRSGSGSDGTRAYRSASISAMQKKKGNIGRASRVGSLTRDRGAGSNPSLSPSGAGSPAAGPPSPPPPLEGVLSASTQPPPPPPPLAEPAGRMQLFRFQEDLVTISLRGMELNDADASGLARSLGALSKLRALNLADNCLGGRQQLSDEPSTGGLERLCAAVNDHAGVTQLDVSFNLLGAEGGAVVAGMLKASGCPLQSINLGSCWLGGGEWNDGDVSGLCAIADALDVNESSRLQELLLPNNCVCGKWMRHWTASWLHGLERLAEEENHAASRLEAAERLLEPAERTLQQLCDAIGRAGRRVLMNPAAGPPLRVVDLSENNLQDRGAAVLAKLLSQPGATTVQTWRLEYNAVSATGVGAVGRAVQANGKLRLQTETPHLLVVVAAAQ